jgi:hypothetical protein
MKLLLILSILAFAGCSTTVPVTTNNPYEFAPSLLEECKDPEFINPEGKLSDNVKIMIDNNTKATECRVAKKALNETIQMRREIYQKTLKK